ncbi:MAG: flagellar basal-body MS-ring/collar protein FliF [Verrucomicrobiota bacterium]
MNQLMDDIAKMWNGLNGPRKLSLIATAIFSIAILSAVILYSSKPKLSLLYANIAQTEAAKVVDHLQSKQIPFELKDNGTTIMVPANKVYEIRLDLAQEGIPRTADTAGGVGFEIFDTPKFGMSDFVQKANYVRALQGELARTITQLEEVDQARVMIVMPEKRLFSKSRDTSKASVFLKLRSTAFLETRQVQAIRFLVANGVEGLLPTRVTIVDSSGNGLALDQQEESVTNLTASQLEARRNIEDHLRNKAQSMLDLVMGPGQSVVRVSAELEFDSVEQTSEKFDPNVAVVRKEEIDSQNKSSETSGAVEAAGVSSNLAEENEAGGKVNKTSETKENTANEYEINRIVETRMKTGARIGKLSVAVFVNVRKTGVGADAQVVPRTPQELQALEDIVKNAVGTQTDTTRQDSVQIQETEFNDLFAVDTAESAPSGIAGQVDQYVPYISQGFLILLAIAVMMYFRNIVKNSAAKDGEDNPEFADILEKFEQLKKEDEESQSRALAETRAASILNVEEMSRLIRENPGNTSQAIRQWMNKN